MTANFKEIKKQIWGKDFIKGYFLAKSRYMIYWIKRLFICYIAAIIGAYILVEISNLF